MIVPRESHRGKTSSLPEQFMLLPTGGEALKVMISSLCVGYVWTENDTWLARNQEGHLLNAPSETLIEAITALFKAYSKDLVQTLG